MQGGTVGVPTPATTLSTGTTTGSAKTTTKSGGGERVVNFGFGSGLMEHVISLLTIFMLA